MGVGPSLSYFIAIFTESKKVEFNFPHSVDALACCHTLDWNIILLFGRDGGQQG